MSLSAAAASGAPFGAADDSVYRAVAAGASVDDVRRVIEQSRSIGAAVNQAGPNGETPLQAARRLHRLDLFCLLLENGALAGDGDRFAAVIWCVGNNDLAGLRRLIERGVSVNTVNNAGFTPLMEACWYLRMAGDRRDLALEIFRRSSAKSRRAVDTNGKSAIDWIIASQDDLRPWQAELVVKLLVAGAPVLRRHAALVMPFAVRALPLAAAHAARCEAELVACRSAAHHWRAQETYVGVSMDMGELRQAQRAVSERRARLAMLELELGS